MAEKNITEMSLPEYLSYVRSKNVPENRLRSYIDIYVSSKARESRTPVFGKLELTPLCNLDCKMCYVHLSPCSGVKERMLPKEKWFELIDGACENGMIQTELSGGECLTYPDFEEIYLYLHSKGVEVSVYTNAVLLDEKRIAFFKKHPPRRVQITLYGSSEDEYEAVTGHRMFGRVMGNILAAKEAGLPVEIALTPNAFMLSGERLVETAAQTGLPYKINYALFEPRSSTGRAGGRYDIALEAYVAMQKTSARYKGIDITALDPNEMPDVGTDTGRCEKGVRCGAGKCFFAVNWEGIMYPCTALEVTKAYPLRDGFKTAWEQVSGAIAEYPVPAECVSCEYREVCVPCPAVHMTAEKGHANPDVCEKTKRCVKEGLLVLP